ncbi:hypothetical protein HDF24_02480 [Mucilaginibacter sp. X4EP1]|uniref:hypothetical protein n=1 Tax=Mucilaginibacter sp. X4EP1 TaxID=2723092 RepID=UPI0021692EF5|nr:hypothetical protein [Mucilaginibacter sp. X4EP1]MCS3811884.1 hypothetical protein [Mucilaginibacter sp. X4EP1]
MDAPIRTIDDLRAEIFRLKGEEKVKSVALGQRFRNPSALFSTLMTLFPKPTNADGTKSAGFFEQDIVGLISRFILPFALNKTIFKNSNFIIKTLVGLVSQKASHFITEDNLVGIWDKVTSFFKSKTKEEPPIHKGVPPLSETY